MKKKIIFGVAVCLFAVATMFNISLSQLSNISDISLKNIQVMTNANAEICATYYGGETICCFPLQGSCLTGQGSYSFSYN